MSHKVFRMLQLVAKHSIHNMHLGKRWHDGWQNSHFIIAIYIYSLCQKYDTEHVQYQSPKQSKYILLKCLE